MWALSSTSRGQLQYGFSEQDLADPAGGLWSAERLVQVCSDSEYLVWIFSRVGVVEEECEGVVADRCLPAPTWRS